MVAISSRALLGATAAVAIVVVGGFALLDRSSGVGPTGAIPAVGAEGITDIGWDNLVPEDEQATLLSGTVVHEQLSDASNFASSDTTSSDAASSDMASSELASVFAEVDAFASGDLSDMAPPWQDDTDVTKVRSELDGTRVRLAGYMTPLSFDDAEVGEFLLVPYVGACVHVPPPPANQIVYVEVDGTVPILEMWEPFYAVGTLRTEPQSTELAEIGYTMSLEHIEIYEEPEIDVFDDTGGAEPA